MSLRRVLYTLVLYIIFPLVLLRLLLRSRSNPDYRKRWSERLGFIPKNIKKMNEGFNGKPLIWLHAVSVGEVIAAKPLIKALLLEYPHNPILVTTTTPTGSDRVKAIIADQIENQQLFHVYFPYDLLGSVSRFIESLKPKILIVVETEIWPNLYASCNQQAIPVIMINARLSNKSTDGYLKIKNLIAETLSYVSLIAVRSKSDAERFIKLGAKTNQIEEVGNIKYDINIDKSQVLKAHEYLEILNKNEQNKHLVFVAASTHRGEDTKILFIYKNLLKLFPDLLLVLVPRHPERFDEVYMDCLEQLPEDMHAARYSRFSEYTRSYKQKLNVILGDSMGEMQMWYALADIVFIGGSLVNTGGHNPLEATIFGIPVISGPYMFNFDDIASELSAEELLLLCDDEFEVIKKMTELLKITLILNKQDSKDNQFKEKASEFMQQHRGITARLINRISKYVSE